MSLFPGTDFLGTFRMIACDPPWAHNCFGQAKHGAAKAVYDEMPLASLCEMPVASLAHPEGCVLLLWCTGVQAADGAHVELSRAWGFRLTTRLFSWVKTADKCADCGHAWREHEEHLVTEDAPGPCAIGNRTEDAEDESLELCDCEQFVVRARRGPGSYSMQGVEDVWLGIRGDGWNRERARRDVPEILFEPITKHSSKPERIYQRAEALWPTAAPRLELFARRRRPGWHAWGKEAPSCDFVFGADVGTTWPVARVQAPTQLELLSPGGGS